MQYNGQWTIMVKIDYVKKMQKMVKKRIQDGVYAKVRAN